MLALYEQVLPFPSPNLPYGICHLIPTRVHILPMSVLVLEPLCYVGSLIYIPDDILPTHLIYPYPGILAVWGMGDPI